MTRIPCLSVRQPWAWALVAGHKGVENRSWCPDYRGPLLIHASGGRPPVEDCRRVGALVSPRVVGWYFDTDNLARSAIIGMVDVVDIVGDSESPWAIDGQYHWVIRNAVKFANPVPCKGKLRFWYPPPALLNQLIRELRAT